MHPSPDAAPAGAPGLTVPSHTPGTPNRRLYGVCGLVALLGLPAAAVSYYLGALAGETVGMIISSVVSAVWIASIIAVVILNKRVYGAVSSFLRRPGWTRRPPDPQTAAAMRAAMGVIAPRAVTPAFPPPPRLTASIATQYGPANVVICPIAIQSTSSTRPFGRQARQPMFTYIWLPLPRPIPPLLIRPQLQQVARRAGDIDIESEQFNRRFRVSPVGRVMDQASYERYAYALVNPRSAGVMLTTESAAMIINDGFACAMSPMFAAEIEANARAVAGFVAAIPSYVYSDYGRRTR